MKGTAPISFAGSQLAETRHVCAFFNSDEEEYRVLLPFIKDGFECGHKAVHVVNPDQRSEHIAAAGCGRDRSGGSGTQWPIGASNQYRNLPSRWQI